MSVRKRAWKTAKGETKTAYVADYVDQKGERHIKTFDRKKEADAYQATVKVEVRHGMHTPDSESITVAQAGEHWIKTGEGNDLERATLDEYRRHLDMHIAPYLGNVKLSKLSAPMVSEFRNKLREGTPAPGQESARRSPAMVKKIIGSLSSILADAHEVGYVAQNVARSLTSCRKKRTKAAQRRKLKVGIDIPTPQEIKAIVAHLPEGRWRTLLLTAIFTGLRASELRGLHWSDVNLNKNEIHVHQRADRYNKIDAPSLEAGERIVPLPPIVVSALREWKLACPKGELGLVFPNGAGNVESHANIINRALVPVQIAAGVCMIVKDADGKVVHDDKGDSVKQAKYTGLHCLRHFYASWCINRTVDGGLELPGKVVQERLGHSSIVMTMDVYGHLFPSGHDKEKLAEAATALLA